MKRILLLGWLLLLFTACQQDDTDIAPEEKPDARLNKVLNDYKALLTGAEHGWKASLSTELGEVYSLMLKFAPDGRVTMASDINATTGTPLESSYRLKGMQQPTLLFDTYSHLHILADPDPRKNMGFVAQGRFSDFEFIVESATAETINLKGQLQGSTLVLTKATQAEAASYSNTVGAYVGAFEQLNSFITYFKRLTVGSKAYDIQVSTAGRAIAFTYFTGETSQVFVTRYHYSQEGLVLQEPFTHEGLTISVLQAPQFNTASGQLNFTVNNVAATIRQTARPVKVDVQTARNFFNSATGDNYWGSTYGFTIRGVVDTLKLSSIPDYRFLVLWPRFDNFNNVEFDLLGFVKIDAEGNHYIAYGPGAVSRVTSDGRITYGHLVDLGEIPAQEEPAITLSRQMWTDPQGFFVVKTGDSSVDLVSAKDGQAWLSLSR
jgi:Domain of unknown function (DUF4302)